MKKTITLIFGVLVAIAAIAQTPLKIYKSGDKYKVDIKDPLTVYPMLGIEVDSTTFPKIPTVPPVQADDTTKIDGRNGVFVGAWTHATGNVSWSGGTMSWSNVAGNTVTYKFQGTKIELWAERKTGHGVGTITVKLGTNIVKTEVVDFRPKVGERSPVLPALIFTIGNLTPLTNYTIELKVSTPPAGTQGWNLVDFLVIWDYKQSTAGPDPEPPTPNPGEILIQPGQDINNAIKNLTRGANVRLAAGNHSVGKLAIPDGVNFRGSGKNNTFIHVLPGLAWPMNSSEAMIYLTGGTGGQVISDFTIEGNKTATGGFFVNRNNVSIQNVLVRNCKFFGGWTHNNIGFSTYELDLKDNSWSDVGWCSGELVLGGHMRNFDIELGLIQTTVNTKGYALKILWNSDTDNSNKLENGKIHGGRIDLMHYSRWNNGMSKNIGIEFHNVDILGLVEIYDMIIENQTSFSLQRNNTGTINVYRCVFKQEGDTYILEHIGNNINLYDCQAYETAMILANFRGNMKCRNATVNRITFTSPSGSAMYGALIYTGESGVENVKVTNSTIDQMPGMALVRHRADGSTCSGNPACKGVTIDGSNTIY